MHGMFESIDFVTFCSSSHNFTVLAGKLDLYLWLCEKVGRTTCSQINCEAQVERPSYVDPLAVQKIPSLKASKCSLLAMLAGTPWWRMASLGPASFQAKLSFSARVGQGSSQGGGEGRRSLWVMVSVASSLTACAIQNS